MKILWKYITRHLTEDFRFPTYAIVLAFLAISVFLNYNYHIIREYVRPLHGLTRTFWYFVVYALAYYFPIAAIAITKRTNLFLKERAFWIKSLLGILLLSVDTSLPYLREFIESALPTELHSWSIKTGYNLISFLTVMAPLFVYYKLYDSPSQFYGLGAGQFDKRPYVFMLLIMTPIVIAASFHPSFVNQYPMYKSSEAHAYLHVPEWVTMLGYELAYGLDFITVELLFRGFLVIGMTRLLGRNAVLSMASLYCFLHFGKPAGEALSSIAGGFILGIIAYETRSIWGGIMVHLGIAWMMEIVAFIQKSFD